MDSSDKSLWRHSIVSMRNSVPTACEVGLPQCGFLSSEGTGHVPIIQSATGHVISAIAASDCVVWIGSRSIRLLQTFDKSARSDCWAVIIRAIRPTRLEARQKGLKG